MIRPALRAISRVVNTPRLLVATIVAIWIVCSWTYSLIEHKGPVEGLWWGIVTGSTVGYGDFYPESTIGRGVAAVLIVSMLVLVPIAIGHFIARMVTNRNEFTHEEQVELLRLTREVHHMLTALTDPEPAPGSATTTERTPVMSWIGNRRKRKQQQHLAREEAARRDRYTDRQQDVPYSLDPTLYAAGGLLASDDDRPSDHGHHSTPDPTPSHDPSPSTYDGGGWGGGSYDSGSSYSGGSDSGGGSYDSGSY